MSPPAPPALLVRALTILWRPWEKGVLPVPVPIDFEPETTAQQRSPSSYASTSKASDGQAASLARSEGGREHPTRRDCLPSRLLFWPSGGLLAAGSGSGAGFWASVSSVSAPFFFWLVWTAGEEAKAGGTRLSSLTPVLARVNVNMRECESRPGVVVTVIVV